MSRNISTACRVEQPRHVAICCSENCKCGPATSRALIVSASTGAWLLRCLTGVMSLNLLCSFNDSSNPQVHQVLYSRKWEARVYAGEALAELASRISHPSSEDVAEQIDKVTPCTISPSLNSFSFDVILSTRPPLLSSGDQARSPVTATTNVVHMVTLAFWSTLRDICCDAHISAILFLLSSRKGSDAPVLLRRTASYWSMHTSWTLVCDARSEVSQRELSAAFWRYLCRFVSRTNSVSRT